MRSGRIRKIASRTRLGTIDDIHFELRRLILDGVFKPGMRLSQIELMRRLNVGRTPLREALRMLQQEGLIVAERNQRARVVSFDPEVLEAVYAERILLSSLGISMTVPQLTRDDLAILERCLAEMHQAGLRQDFDAWEKAHRAFHRGLVVRTSEHLKIAINRLADRCRFYRRLWTQAEPGYWGAVADENHRAILEACRSGDCERAVQLLANHFARTALKVLAHVTPEREPRIVRGALRLMLRIGPDGLYEPSNRDSGRAAGRLEGNAAFAAENAGTESKKAGEKAPRSLSF